MFRRVGLASWVLGALVGMMALGGVACGSDSDGGSGCTPGQQTSCSCPGGTQGVQVCNDSGAYGACDCGGQGGSGGGGDSCGNGVIDFGEQCDDGNTDNTDSCTNQCTINTCGDGIQQAGECDPNNEVSYCPADCGGGGAGGGNNCAGQVNFAGITAPQPSVWQFNGLTSVPAGDAMCDALQPGQGLHVCEYQQVRAAETAMEPLFVAIADGTTAWIHRTTDEMVNGQLSPAGPGGRCNDWTYGTNHISDGEFATFAASAVTYHLDNDTFYDGVDTTHTIPGDLDCGPVAGNKRVILCCYPVCVP